MSNIETLKSFGFNFNKNFGQNFIFDKNLLNSIVDDADIDKNTVVVEIGCGAGTLTRAIATKAKRVIGFEIDKNLQPVLQETLHGLDNIEINFVDVMKQSIADLEQRINEKYVIIANLPYYITTPIIFKFLNESKLLKRFVIMVQLEVAQRLVAKAGSKDYGSITAQIDAVGNAKITRIVKKNMFVPVPKVDSAVVRVDFENKYNILDKETLEKVIKSAFQMRRKTIYNNLKSAFDISGEKMLNLLKCLNISASARAETLDSSQFVELANMIYKEGEEL